MIRFHQNRYQDHSVILQGEKKKTWRKISANHTTFLKVTRKQQDYVVLVWVFFSLILIWCPYCFCGIPYSISSSPVCKRTLYLTYRSTKTNCRQARLISLYSLQLTEKERVIQWIILSDLYSLDITWKSVWMWLLKFLFKEAHKILFQILS